MITPLLLAFASIALPQTAFDDFNRPDGTDMGPNWTEVDGDTVINTNRGQGNSPFVTGWMHHNGLTGDYSLSVQEIEFFANNFGGDSVSLMAGLDPNTWDCVFIKIQDNNGDGLFDRLFFYRGVNGGSWGGASVWFDLATPTVSGKMKLSFRSTGDAAVVEIDNHASGLTETFQGSGILSMPNGPPTGTHFGIAHFGDPFFDDWSASVGVTGPLYALTPLIAGQSSTGQVSNVAAFADIIVAYSTAGPGPTSTPFGMVAMSPPIQALPRRMASASGVLLFNVKVPLGARGMTVYTQALELPARRLSNPLAAQVR